MSSTDDTSFEEPEEETVANVAVLNKYKLAGEITNKAVKAVLAKCVEGQSVRELCDFADKLILDETSLIFKKEKDLKKGIAFPCCISINNCVCHYSPLKSDPDVTLKSGDLVKIDLGAHIDGYIALNGYTTIVGASKENPVSARKADVVHAAATAMNAALRLMKGGVENTKVTEAIQKSAEAYKCKPIEGMLSHQLYRNQFEGKKSIIQNPSDTQRADHEKEEFGVNEVYALDIFVSSGEGKSREQDTRTTVFRKSGETYNLRMKASRAFFSEVLQKHDVMGFNLRHFEDEKKARLGLSECINHGLLHPFPVLYEKEAEFVAQFKCTIAITATGVQKISGLSLDLESYKTAHKVTDSSLKETLNAATKTNKKKKSKAKRAVQEMTDAVAKLTTDDQNKDDQGSEDEEQENKETVRDVQK